MKILSISDEVDPLIYSPNIKNRFGDVDLVLACGDLPYYYQEFIISTLNCPLCFVHGNHDPEIERGSGKPRSYPHGGIDLHRNITCVKGVLLAGVEGSILYSNRSLYQYSQSQMWRHVLRLVPGLMWNRFRYGRHLDIFISHAPPWGIHEGQDFAHQGIKAFRWLVATFQPRYHFHGHVHHYHPDTVIETRVGRTTVINTYPYKVTEFER
ncbi:MAG: metallophosphoesterase [Anaerolineales bacterium]